MKLLRSFLAMLVFTICATFCVYAGDAPPEKIVILKQPAAERFAPVEATETPSPNFIRTDALVFYESNAQVDSEDGEQLSPCTDDFDIEPLEETFYASFTVDKRLVRPKQLRQRAAEFIYL